MAKHAKYQALDRDALKKDLSARSHRVSRVQAIALGEQVASKSEAVVHGRHRRYRQRQGRYMNGKITITEKRSCENNNYRKAEL